MPLTDTPPAVQGECTMAPLVDDLQQYGSSLAQGPQTQPPQRSARALVDVSSDIICAVLGQLDPARDRDTILSCSLVCRQFTVHTRKFTLRRVTLRSSAEAMQRAKETVQVCAGGGQRTPHEGIGSMFEEMETLKLDLDDGHRWIYSTILSPAFKTSDLTCYDRLREQGKEVDELLSRFLFLVSGFTGLPTASPCIGPLMRIADAPGPHRALRELVVSHYTFHPFTSQTSDLMFGWKCVFGMGTLETLSLGDVLDLPLSLLGHAGTSVKNLKLLRVKLDRRDSKRVWSAAAAGAEGSGVKTLRPRHFSILDCYAETIDPLVACAENAEGFLDLGHVEQLTVHPCLAVQAPAYNEFVKTVITHSATLNHLVWTASCRWNVTLDLFATLTPSLAQPNIKSRTWIYLLGRWANSRKWNSSSAMGLGAFLVSFEKFATFYGAASALFHPISTSRAIRKSHLHKYAAHERLPL